MEMDNELKETIRTIHDCVAKQMYEKGIDDAIRLIEKLMERYENLPHDAYYISVILSDLDDLVNQLKEKKND